MFLANETVLLHKIVLITSGLCGSSQPGGRGELSVGLQIVSLVIQTGSPAHSPHLQTHYSLQVDLPVSGQLAKQ